MWRRIKRWWLRLQRRRAAAQDPLRQFWVSATVQEIEHLVHRGELIQASVPGGWRRLYSVDSQVGRMLQAGMLSEAEIEQWRAHWARVGDGNPPIILSDLRRAPAGPLSLYMEKGWECLGIDVNNDADVWKGRDQVRGKLIYKIVDRKTGKVVKEWEVRDFGAGRTPSRGGTQYR